MSAVPPIQAHSNVEIDDSCNDCSGCCWGRKVRKEKHIPRERREQIMDQIKDSHDVYNFTVNVEQSEKPPLKRDPSSVRDLSEIIAGIQDKK